MAAQRDQLVSRAVTHSSGQLLQLVVVEAVRTSAHQPQVALAVVLRHQLVTSLGPMELQDKASKGATRQPLITRLTARAVADQAELALTELMTVHRQRVVLARPRQLLAPASQEHQEVRAVLAMCQLQERRQQQTLVAAVEAAAQWQALKA